jgi:hypothetical protein
MASKKRVPERSVTEINPRELYKHCLRRETLLDQTFKRRSDDLLKDLAFESIFQADAEVDSTISDADPKSCRRACTSEEI